MERRNRMTLFGVALAGSSLVLVAGARAQLDDRSQDHGRAAVAKALSYLIATQQADGGWTAFGRSHPAVTSLAVKGLIQDASFGPEHPAVKRAVALILRYVQPDGGIYVPGEGMRNYHTCVALMALAALEDPTCAGALRNAKLFIKSTQWNERNGHDRVSSWHGGQGYGKHKRPDLSNTQMMLEALEQSGLSPDDPVYRRAMVFVSRCQMLDKTNDQRFADGSRDGGFIYTPVAGGESKAGTEVSEGGEVRLRSYGSMTYAGFKSLLYAGVDRDDVRVRRAMDWIRRHYSLDGNPNMPSKRSKEGLYYYYHVFARALRAWGAETIVDSEGRSHVWRAELIDKLVRLQRPGGSWINDTDRWYEGNPHLTTAYAVLSLQTALEP